MDNNMVFQLLIRMLMACQSVVYLHGTSLRSTRNIGYFWHVTDFHYDHTYWTSGLSCNDEVPNPGKFGDYWCDAPWSLIEESIKEMAEVKKDVDFLIWTGDSVAHIKNEHLNVELNQEIVRNLTEALNASFSAPVYASLGNHDFYKSDQAPPGLDAFYSNVSDYWGDWIDNAAQKELFKKGGYYMVQLHDKLRLFALNTNLYYTANKLTTNMTDPAGQLKWMEEQLKDARDNDQKVILTGHIPVGLVTPGIADWFQEQYTVPFLKLITDNSDIITSSHFGHNHRDAFMILQQTVMNGPYAKAVAQYTAPSVTPWRFKIPNLTGAPHNPGVRLIKYDRDTGENLDYDQYFMNLTQANKDGAASWKKLYTFTTAYRVQDMSVTSLRQIFHAMRSAESREAQQFCNAVVVSELDKPCTLEMRADIYCGGLHPYIDSAKACSKGYIEEGGADRWPNMGGGADRSALGLRSVYVAVVCFALAVSIQH